MTAGTLAKFPGNAEEKYAFMVALSHNCSCVSAFGMTLEACSLHHSLTVDAMWPIRSVYARRLAPKLRQEEGLAA